MRRATNYRSRRRHHQNISIHALLAESDLVLNAQDCNTHTFLSTLSLRRATARRASRQQPAGDFYPRSPCGERRQWRRSVKLFRQFLSTLSLRRATIISKPDRCTTVPFLSTLSLRRATSGRAAGGAGLGYFYPRSPCGERQSSIEEVSKYVVISIHALLAESDESMQDRPKEK